MTGRGGSGGLSKILDLQGRSPLEAAMKNLLRFQELVCLKVCKVDTVDLVGYVCR